MRRLFIPVLGLMLLAPAATADVYRSPDAAASTVVRPHHQAAPAPRRVVRRVARPHYYGYRLAYYPPTYIRDGHSYFYFPDQGGRRDQPAEPYVKHHRHSWRYR